MCGFAGFLSQPDCNDVMARTALAMSETLVHRGPDSSGVWTDHHCGVALAHRRLAIVDLSAAGHQPMASSSGRWIMAFNGEIYNHGEIRAALDATNPQRDWRGTSDTETLIAAIDHWGVRQALERAVGMFAFAAWDCDRRRLTLARDRLGEKPLYYARAGRSFLFASDPSAFRRHPEFEGAIDRDAIAGLLKFGYVPAPASIFVGASKLPCASILTIDAATRTMEIESYWDANAAAEAGASSPFSGSPEEAVDELERRLASAIAGQQIADVPIGAFLSGGVDSSAVVATLQAQSNSPVKTFTIGFDDAAYDESEHAKAIAKHLGTDHNELRISDSAARDVVPDLPSIYAEPFADASQIPTYLVSKFARECVTVSISGDGGDELFSGYRRHDVAARYWPNVARAPMAVRNAAARALKGLAPATWDRIIEYPMTAAPKSLQGRRIGETLHKSAEVLEAATLADAYTRLSTHWRNAEEIVIGASAPHSDNRSAASNLDPVKNMMLSDLTGYLPDGVLTKLDRASMAVSLESRVPLLDHRLVEFAMSLPTTILRRDGRGKWPLRALLARRVPQSLFDRPKSGFSVPIDTWLRGPLRDWSEDLLSETRLRREGYFDPKPLRQTWADCLAGRGANAHKVWTVLMFQAWLAHWNDRPQ